MKWDWTLNAGNVLTALVLLIGFLTAHRQNIERLKAMETKVDLIFEWFRINIIHNGKGE